MKKSPTAIRTERGLPAVLGTNRGRGVAVTIGADAGGARTTVESRRRPRRTPRAQNYGGVAYARVLRGRASRDAASGGAKVGERAVLPRAAGPARGARGAATPMTATTRTRTTRNRPSRVRRALILD